MNAGIHLFIGSFLLCHSGGDLSLSLLGRLKGARATDGTGNPEALLTGGCADVATCGTCPFTAHCAGRSLGFSDLFSTYSTPHTPQCLGPEVVVNRVFSCY